YGITPYFTIKAFKLSLQVDEFERDVFLYLKKMMRWAWLLRLFYRKREIWVVGERPYKAQDTGYHFFKYMRQNHPKRNVFYVIEENSTELRNIKDLGNILYFKSKEHIWHTLMATRIIGSHHPDYLYPLRTNEFKKAVKAKKIFLQHGVMGTKNTVHFYGKSSPSFSTDLFIVSSDFEKRMIVNDFGYDSYEVAVTGLSRFDSLLKKDVDKKRQLLIIPTWREWLVTDDAFLESEYFDRYRELVYHPSLHDLANKYQFEIILCLHPNMQKFTHFFKDAPVRVISQGEVDVQYLMKESAMMLTDYSSVGFDFSFLHRPILYYQFDRKRFIGKRGSHLDLDNDLPGDIVYDVNEILQHIEEYAKNDFLMKPENQVRASKFLKYTDLNASKRIYEAVDKFKTRKSILKKISEDELVRAFYKRFRKSHYYFPTMHFLYNIMRRVLPVDNKLIVFESGVGKQYADSPKMIYEEIIKRGLKFNKVWFYNKKHRFHDDHTIRVARLSPKYYYYLAKAKYWVNNQNFPTHLKKRKETIYIQTWHGTPLKKMAFDIKQVHGRSEDYVERIYKASQRWDCLISPSEYATNAFKSAFRYTGNILEVGYPRNDIFYKPEKEKMAEIVKERLGLPENKKVILYAPTFRDNQKEKNKFVFDIPFDFEQLKEKLGEEYILLLRMHVVVSGKIHIPEEVRDFVYNVSKYPDIQELYLITDILMTDYSSVMFDFANLKRPMLFYTYDFELYRDQLRGFYMNFEEEAPGPFLRTTDDIIDAVRNIDQIQQRYGERYEAFYEKYCGLEDGKATERVVDRLFSK
ncbi:CDP-glycerol glycerophosphotransferase family protein, partial [Fictibacillus sp. Mic-4]|uniref:CDP-glycerol glycerophosphotransferase family protein n=1 Tax=Fictibacillus sp. Mic-4 TaxID=3132826 RepID=UPI003CFAEA65